MTLLCASWPSPASRRSSGFFSKDAILAAAYAARALDVLGRRVHRGHDRFLRLPRILPGLLRRVPRRMSIRTNRRLVMVGSRCADPRRLSLAWAAASSTFPKWLRCLCSRVPKKRPESPALHDRLRGLRPDRHRARVCFYVVAPAIPESLAPHLQPPLPLDLQQVFRRRSLRFDRRQPAVDGSRSLLWRVVDAGAASTAS